MKKIITFLLVLVICLSLCGCKSSDYRKATTMFESGKYQKAKELFGNLGEYKDSAEMLSECSVKECEALIEDIGVITYYSEYVEKDFQKAMSAYNSLTNAEKDCVRNAELLRQREAEFNEALFLEKASEYVIEEATGRVKSCANSTFKLRTDKKSHASANRSVLDPNELYGNYTVYFSLNNDGLRENYKYSGRYTLKIEDGEFGRLSLGRLDLATIDSFMKGYSSYFKPEYDD